MRAFRDPFADSPEEALAETFAAFELTEARALRELRCHGKLPAHLADGVAAGRLTEKRGRGGRSICHLVIRRLAFRRMSRYASGRRKGFPRTLYVVVRDEGTGAVLRLPFG